MSFLQQNKNSEPYPLKKKNNILMTNSETNILNSQTVKLNENFHDYCKLNREHSFAYLLKCL